MRALALVAAFCLALAGCSPQGGAPVGGCVQRVSGADLSSPTVSLVADVIPIFRQSCAIGGASCHGDPLVITQSRPFLGTVDEDAGASTAQVVWSGLVGVKSAEDLTMNLVTAHDPGTSFLMHKMDGDQCTLVSECMMAGSYRPNCGAAMPYQAPDILPAVPRDTVRRWIWQGAKND
jgi:hypothetical protein